MALFDSLFGGSGGGDMPFGYSGLTPDQAAVVRDQGFFYRPDAQNTGLQQPEGYSNLTPDQIQAVNTQGFYTNPAAPQQSLWDKLAAGLGGQDFKDLQKTVAGMGAQQQQLALPPASPPRYPPAQNPYFNIYRRSQTDPRA